MGKTHCLNRKKKKIKAKYKKVELRCCLGNSQKVRENKGKRVLRRRKKDVRVLIILQDGRLNNVGFGSNLT